MNNVLVFAAVLVIVLILIMLAVGKIGVLVGWNAKITLAIDIILLVVGAVVISRKAGWF